MLCKKVTLGEVGGRVYGSARFLQIFREFEIIPNKEMPIPVDSVMPLFCVETAHRLLHRKSKCGINLTVECTGFKILR